MLPTLILVGLASLHSPAPSFANFVFTVPVRIESMTHMTGATVTCTVLHTSPTSVPVSVGSGLATVPVRDGSFTGNVTVTVVASDARIASYPPTRYTCGLVYTWRNPDGSTYSESHILGERERFYTRITGQEITTATVEATGDMPSR